MRKGRLLVLSLLLPAAVLAAETAVVEYASPLLTFYLRLPSDWRVAETRERVDFLHPEYETNGFSVAVHSSTEPYGPGQFQRFKSQMRVASRGFRVVAEADERFGGSSGHQMEFEADSPSGSVRHQSVFVESPNGTFYADCRLLAKFADELGPDCEPILDSFRPNPTRDQLSLRRVVSSDGALTLSLPPGWRETTAETAASVPDTVLSVQRPAGTVNFRRATIEAGALDEYVAEGARLLAEKAGAKLGPVETLAAGPIELRAALLELPQLEMLTGAFISGGRAYGVESVSRSPGLTWNLVQGLLAGAELNLSAAAAPARKPGESGGRVYLLSFIFGAMGLALFYGLAMLLLSLPSLEKKTADAQLHLPGEYVRDWRPPTGPDWVAPMRGWITWWPVRKSAPVSGEGELRRVGVVGAGTMGSGIAQLLAQNGLDVSLFDPNPSALRAGLDRIRTGLEKAGSRDALTRIEPTGELESLGACGLVIEAAFEDADVKKELFRKLGSILPPPSVLATNTSSLSVREIAEAAQGPERVVGMHFFNPAPVMKLVEVVPHEGSSPQARDRIVALAHRLGKTPVMSADSPGFIANRLVRPFYLKPLQLAIEGAAGVGEIDEAMRRRGFKMGPFELMDLIGLDVNLTITNVLHEGLGERFKPSKLQQELVAKGFLGRKSGAGFYLYVDGRRSSENPALAMLLPPRHGLPDLDSLFRQVLGDVGQEARRIVQEKVATAADVDAAMRLGFNWPKGPIEWSREL